MAIAMQRRPRGRRVSASSASPPRQSHPGRHMLDGEYPTLGAWVHYGLGTLNDNLPQFVSMGKREYWNLKDGHYLGPAHDAVPVRVDPANPLDYGKPEGSMSAA